MYQLQINAVVASANAVIAKTNLPTKRDIPSQRQNMKLDPLPNESHPFMKDQSGQLRPEISHSAVPNRPYDFQKALKRYPSHFLVLATCEYEPGAGNAHSTLHGNTPRDGNLVTEHSCKVRSLNHQESAVLHSVN